MSYLRSLRSQGHRALDQVEPLVPAFVTPNRLSWSRVWGTPIIWGAYLWHPLLAFCLYTVLCLTDWLDGYLAEKRGLMTAYGKKLDERTDKVLMVGVIALLFADQIIPLDAQSWLFWVVAVLVIRDSIMTTLREMWPQAAERMPSLLLAKLKTFAMMPAFGLMLLGNLSNVSIIPDVMWEVLYTLGLGLLCLSLVFSLVSLIQYLYEFWIRVTR